MKYMGIDVGTKRIGIALSDMGGSVAFPYSVVEVQEGSTAKILQLIVDEGIERVVIGDSVSRSNIKNPVAEHAQSLGDVIRKAGHDVIFAWEGYTSAHARRLHSFEEGAPRGTVSRQRRRAGTRHVDATAAALILQSVLDNESA